MCLARTRRLLCAGTNLPSTSFYTLGDTNSHADWAGIRPFACLFSFAPWQVCDGCYVSAGPKRAAWCQLHQYIDKIIGFSLREAKGQLNPGTWPVTLISQKAKCPQFQHNNVHNLISSQWGRLKGWVLRRFHKRTSEEVDLVHCRSSPQGLLWVQCPLW